MGFKKKLLRGSFTLIKVQLYPSTYIFSLFSADVFVSADNKSQNVFLKLVQADLIY